MVDPRLTTLPAVVALATANAREQYEAEAALAREQGLGDTPDEPGDWAWLVAEFPRMSSIRVEAHLALLCDLSRPASRDQMIRLIIESGSRASTVSDARFHRDDPAALTLIALHTLGAPRG